MADDFDVIVVGARCAGASLATLLAREGVRTAVVERATFPRDTLSTHIFQGPSINFLGRLGVLDEVLATGAVPVNRVEGRQEDLHYAFDVPLRPGDLGAFMSVRRHVIDPILAGAAERAGTEMVMGGTVTGLHRDGERVAGVTVRERGRQRTLRARLVVGADGRNSTVGDHAGSRKYNVTPGERFGYWGFFDGTDRAAEPVVVYHRWAGRFVIAMPCDSGLYEVVVFPDRAFLPEFKRDREAAFLAHARACGPVARIIDGAQRTGKLLGMVRFECFFREASGPGWVLVGDAGHFKDPAPGQGMSDAFRQAGALAPVIIGAIHGPAAGRDADLAAWSRWRDQDAAEHYWLAADFGSRGLAPNLQVAILRRMQERDELGGLGDVLQHRLMPSRLFTPGKLLSAATRELLRPSVARRQTLREVRQMMSAEMQHQRLNRRPVFADGAQHRDAGDTEVPLEAAA